MVYRLCGPWPQAEFCYTVQPCYNLYIGLALQSLYTTSHARTTCHKPCDKIETVSIPGVTTSLQGCATSQQPHNNLSCIFYMGGHVRSLCHGLSPTAIYYPLPTIENPAGGSVMPLYHVI